jgi:glycosyltransferase involved in cell wall biosynthesis
MKKKLYFIISIFLLTALIFSWFVYKNYKIKQKKLKKEFNHQIWGHNKINPTTGKPYPVLENKNFVIVIPSYNNELFYKKNLESVFAQNYENYRVIYVDDASQDKTYEKVKQFIEDNHQTHRVTLIHNETNCGPIANIYKMIHSCKDNEIIVTLDGDDWLASHQVLTILNQYYANPNIWVTFGDFITYPTYEKSGYGPFFIGELSKKSFREIPWRTSHLRTFYAGLFKKIDINDLKYQGTFFKMTGDMACMFPIIEMSNPHFCFIPEILYIYNRANVLNEDKINKEKQVQMEKIIRSMPPYQPIKKLSF